MATFMLGTRLNHPDEPCLKCKHVDGFGVRAETESWHGITSSRGDSGQVRSFPEQVGMVAFPCSTDTRTKGKRLSRGI